MSTTKCRTSRALATVHATTGATGMAPTISASACRPILCSTASATGIGALSRPILPPWRQACAPCEGTERLDPVTARHERLWLQLRTCDGATLQPAELQTLLSAPKFQAMLEAGLVHLTGLTLAPDAVRLFAGRRHWGGGTDHPRTAHTRLADSAYTRISLPYVSSAPKTPGTP